MLSGQVPVSYDIGAFVNANVVGLSQCGTFGVIWHYRYLNMSELYYETAMLFCFSSEKFIL